jgi:hypothetical protein
MRDYRVQRPSTVWIETRVEANSFEEALELADEDFYSGDYEQVDDTFDVDYDRHWIEDEDGETREGTDTYELVKTKQENEA